MASATKKVSLLPSEVAATLSPSMQREMSEIVYGRRKSRRPPAHRGQYRSTNPKLRHESTKLHYILSGGEESVYQFAGKDNEDHFASAGGMLLRDDADDGNAFDAVYGQGAGILFLYNSIHNWPVVDGYVYTKAPTAAQAETEPGAEPDVCITGADDGELSFKEEMWCEDANDFVPSD